MTHPASRLAAPKCAGLAATPGRFAMSAGLFTALAAFCLWPLLTPASARTAAPDRAEIAGICDAAAAVGAAAHDVPLDVMRAVTRTETGRAEGGALRPWPWTVNMEGRGRWFDDREEALAYVRAAHARGARSYDIGCFQINYRWHGEAFASVEEMFDPAANARYAARFLSNLKQEGGDWRAAVGRYHSRTPSFAKKYKARFSRILAALDPAPADLAPLRAPTERDVAVGREAPRPVIGAPRFVNIYASAAPAGAQEGAPAMRRTMDASAGGVAHSMFPAGRSLLTRGRPLGY